MNRMQALYALALVASLAVGLACSHEPSAQQQQAWEAQIQQLQAEHDSLRSKFTALAREDPRIKNLPQGDVVIAVPTAFLKNVIERVFTDVASNVTLNLSGIKVHVAKPIKKIITVGEFVLDVEVTEVTGRLKPGIPEVKFGENRVALALPVEVIEGHGKATVHFVWNGKNVANVVCGDLDVTQTVSGKMVPTSYLVAGTLSFASGGKHVTGEPAFPETILNIRVTPSPESWQAINAILEEKHGVCGWVLDKVNVPELLTNLVEKKGFNVKLPLNKVKPFLLPAGVSETVKIAGKTLALEAQTNTIRIDSDAIWMGANVGLKAVLSIDGELQSKLTEEK